MASPSKELEDYWNEFQTIEQANCHGYEDELAKTPDEGELEAAWLNAAGFQSLVSKFKDGNDLSDDEMESLTNTLTQAQAETVRRRINALSTTMRKKHKGNKLHVKDIFPTSDDLPKAQDDDDDATTQNQLAPPDQSQKGIQEPVHHCADSVLQHHQTGSNNVIVQAIQTGLGNLRVHSSNAGQNNTSCQLASHAPVIPSVTISLECHLEERQKFSNVDSAMPEPDSQEMPAFEPKFDPLGVTLVGDLGDCDMEKIKTLAHIELTALFDLYNIVYSRPKRRRKVKEHGIFGVPLEVLVEHDQKKSPGTTVPIVFQTMVTFLEKEGLYAEGILRVSRAETRTKQLRQDLQEKFYQGLFSWTDFGPHDVAVVFKQFLRELPTPLLSYDYLDAFHQISNISKAVEKLKALNLLILLLTKEHRNTLKVLLSFLQKVISHSNHNKMSLNNVAMIMAPNLFMSPHRSNKEKADLELELKKAAGTSNIVKMLIYYQDILWTIPSAFIGQLRHQYTTDVNRKSRVPKLLWKKNKEKSDLYKKLPAANLDQFESKDGLIKVQAPHLNKAPTLVQLDQMMTAADVVDKVCKGDSQGKEDRPDNKMDINNEHMLLNSNDTHCVSDYLFEVGGNIGERCLDPSTKVMDVHLANPNAEWVIRTRSGRPQALFSVRH